MNDDIRELLARGASDAVDTDLVSGTWQRAERHRRNRNLGIVSLAAAGLALTFALTQTGGSGDEALLPADRTARQTAPATQEPNTPALPEEWRWESFGGVQVGIPGDWDWGGPSQRIHQWCLNDEGDRSQPIVGRAGISTAVGCDVDGGASPPRDSLVENTGEVVMFSWSPQPDVRPTEVGDRTTVQVNGVAVTVQARQPLRDQIVSTIHLVTTDANGCTTTHPVTSDSSWRPSGPAVAQLSEVSSISVCRYQFSGAWPRTGGEVAGGILSSLRLEGQDARQAIETIASAYVGGGPNNPDQCAPDFAYGDEAIVLRVTSAAGTSEVVARYSGCDHHGFDDGHEVRTLTREAMAPLIEGPNQPDQASSEVGDIVFPDPGDE
ncbi:hypothetical protein [Ornithinimicrobium cavernae]|uniref:hypothetical protein n=1 Tax=Ornithinimicrobium cavernae TaxID=2666047 RepID=UPI000D691AB0|nr:hypothetical protein [Ornithinimicrobium cavernae]